MKFAVAGWPRRPRVRSEIEYGIVAQRSPIRSTDAGPNRQPPFVSPLIVPRVLDALHGLLAVRSVANTRNGNRQSVP